MQGMKHFLWGWPIVSNRRLLRLFKLSNEAVDQSYLKKLSQKAIEKKVEKMKFINSLKATMQRCCG